MLSSFVWLTFLDFVSCNLQQNPPSRASVVIPVTGESEDAVVQVRLNEVFGRLGHAGPGCCTLMLPAASMSSLPQCALRDVHGGSLSRLLWRQGPELTSGSRSLPLLFMAVGFPFLVLEPQSNSETGVPFNFPNCKMKSQRTGNQKVWVAVNVRTLKGSFHR